jgi:hypothetical protein
MLVEEEGSLVLLKIFHGNGNDALFMNYKKTPHPQTFLVSEIWKDDRVDKLTARRLGLGVGNTGRLRDCSGGTRSLANTKKGAIAIFMHLHFSWVRLPRNNINMTGVPLKLGRTESGPCRHVTGLT